MRRSRLSLRRAAREGHIAVGTLSSLLDASRVADPDRRLKRGVHRGTLLQLRAVPWIGALTTKTLDRLIAATARHY